MSPILPFRLCLRMKCFTYKINKIVKMKKYYLKNDLSSIANNLLGNSHTRKTLVLRLKSQLFDKMCIVRFQQNLNQHNYSNSCSCQFYQSKHDKSINNLNNQIALKTSILSSIQVLLKNPLKSHNLEFVVQAVRLK